jgi:hypothetical protein
MGVADFDGRTLSAWSDGLTERNDSGNVGAASQNWGNGPTGDRTVTLASGGSQWAAFLIALRPATPESIAFDAKSVPTPDPNGLSWSHPSLSKPQGVLVLVTDCGANTDKITSVTYGGVSMTRIADNIFDGDEDGAVYAYLLGSGSIPSGAQTVVVTASGAAADDYDASCYSVIAEDDIEVVDIEELAALLANPSATLSLGGRLCFCALGFVSGLIGTTTSPLTNWASDNEHDGGSVVCGQYSYDIIGTADVTAGWTQAEDEAIMIAVAIGVVAAAVAAPELSWNPQIPDQLPPLRRAVGY